MVCYSMLCGARAVHVLPLYPPHPPHGNPTNITTMGCGRLDCAAVDVVVALLLPCLCLGHSNGLDGEDVGHLFLSFSFINSFSVFFSVLFSFFIF